LFDKSNPTQNEVALSNYQAALRGFYSTLVFHESVIVKEILNETKPVSIYLVGSFARDEGSLRLSKGIISPVRDYDVLIVMNKHVHADIIKVIRKRINKKLGFLDPYSRNYKFGGFTVWITQVTMRNIDALPLLKIYELKESSQLLWGIDVRSKIRMTFEDVSPYNGVLMLFGKVDGLLGLLDIDELRRGNVNQRVDFFYECIKTYAEMGTILNLLNKSYEPSFVRRSLRLSRDFDLLYPDLKRINSSLPSFVVASAYRRLLIDDDSLLGIDFGELLAKTLDDLRITFWYFLRKSYGVDIGLSSKFANMHDEYIKKLNTKLLENLFDFYLKRKIGFKAKFVRELALRTYLRYTLLKFFVEGRRKGYRIKLRILLTQYGNIMLRLWLIGYTLLEGVGDNLNIDESAVSATANRLSEILDLDSSACALLSEGSTESKFRLLQKVYIDLLDFADKIFHQKE
jgi:predicted nucleotidyltransferase